MVVIDGLGNRLHIWVLGPPGCVPCLELLTQEPPRLVFQIDAVNKDIQTAHCFVQVSRVLTKTETRYLIYLGI